ncbi:MAG TPA: MBL fold metallo-hydrolase [Mycobacteriales bacterium]|nr:MBL fold metallo-hydrolase [Mycobacteriales bacterium]
MDLHVLGCAGTFPSADSACSGYLVRHEGFSLLIDVGNGSTGALQRFGGILDVDAVLVSHLHADHCVDLAAYSYARRFHPARPGLLPVYGPKGTQDRLVQIFDTPPRDGLSEVYDFHTVTPGRFELGPFQLDLALANHPVETHAVRVTAGGRTLAYSADTGQSDDVIDLARESDLFLCEATWLEGAEYPDYPPDVHLLARQTGEHATKADVGKLLLIHTISYQDDAQVLAQAGETFGGPMGLAVAGASYAV